MPFASRLTHPILVTGGTAVVRRTCGYPLGLLIGLTKYLLPISNTADVRTPKDIIGVGGPTQSANVRRERRKRSILVDRFGACCGRFTAEAPRSQRVRRKIALSASIRVQLRFHMLRTAAGRRVSTSRRGRAFSLTWVVRGRGSRRGGGRDPGHGPRVRRRRGRGPTSPAPARTAAKPFSVRRRRPR
jgi:hypothetical protein